MRLELLELINFKKHKALMLDFSGGLNVIRGDNWSGKSSILQGVLLALFGTHAVPGVKSRLQNRDGGKMRVALEITADDNCRYRIERTQTAASVSLDGRPIVTSPSAVDEWVSELLGMDRKIALQLCYSPQTHTAALLSLGVTAINKLVEDLSGADYIDRLVGKAGAKVDRLEEQLAKQQGLHPDAEQELRETISQRTQDLEAAQAERSKADAAEAVLRANLETVTADLAKAAGHNTEVRRLIVLKQTLLDKLDKLQKLKLLKLPEIVEVPDYSELQSELDRLKAQEAEHAKTAAQVQVLQGWFETTGQLWVEQEPNIELLTQAEAESEELTAEFDRATESANSARTLHTEAQAEHSRLVAALNVCPTCKRPAADVDREALEARIQKAKALEAVRLEELHTAVAKLNEVKTRQRDLSLVLYRLRNAVPPADYEEVFTQKSAELEKLSAIEIPDLSPQIREAIRQIKAAEDQRRANSQTQTRIALHEREVAELQAFCKQAGAELEGKDLKLVDVVFLTTHKQDLQEAVSVAYTRTKFCLTSEVDLKAMLALLYKHLEEGLASRQKTDELEKVRARWQGFIKWLKASRLQLLTQLWDSITANAGEFLSEVTDGYATELRRNVDGEFVVIEDGEESSAEGGMSGGMAAIAGTALKLSLAKLLPSAPGFLLLDEPSSELNDKHAANLAAALAGQDRQLVLVTHRVGEEFVAERLITLE